MQLSLLFLGLPRAQQVPTSLPHTTRHTIPFPRSVLAKFLADSDGAVPGTRIESPPFESSGCRWQVALYPFGGNADKSFAYRVGIYLRLLPSSNQEVDVTFALRLLMLPNTTFTDDTNERESALRGINFRCGMTFCTPSEAGQSVGRCEDWGAHVYPTNLLLKELESREETVACVEVDMNIWDVRSCRRGASLSALIDQVQRLPRRSIRVGEVVVALSDGRLIEGASKYVCAPGVEYRVMRLTGADGAGRFELHPDEIDGKVYLLPTSRAARAEGRFDTNEDAMYRDLFGDDVVESTDSLPSIGKQEDLIWPTPIPIAGLPKLGSRLSPAALPARLGFAARTSSFVVLMFVLLGASPLLSGYLLSQIGSAYAIPSRSMEATLRVGDVVLAEKLSRLSNLPYQVGDLVLFNPPEELRQLVGERGGKLGNRDLFVKRVAAVGGDNVELLPSGNIAVNGIPYPAAPLGCREPAEEVASQAILEAVPRVIPEKTVFVLGDCLARSTDSRVWGPLPIQNVVARPVVRIWPVERLGAIDQLAEPDSGRKSN